MNQRTRFNKVSLLIMACACALAAQAQGLQIQRLPFTQVSAQQISAQVETLEVDLNLIKIQVPRHTSITAVTKGKGEVSDAKLSYAETQAERKIEVNLEVYTRQPFQRAQNH